MKKLLLALVLCAMVTPHFGFAQIASSTPGTIDIAALVAQLQAKIKELQQQLIVLQQNTFVTDSSDMDGLDALTLTLSRGMSNEEVADLQRYLAQYPDIYPEGVISGYFGALTEQAVKRLQAARGLEAVGIVGPRTRAIINTEITSSSSGSSGGGGVNPTPSSVTSSVVAPTPSPVSPVSATQTSTSQTSQASVATTATSTPAPTPAPVPSDGKGPTITSLSITPTNTTAGGQITFTVTANDINGVGNVIYDIRYPSPYNTYVLRPNCNFNGAVIGTCTFTQSIDGGIQPTVYGTYVIETVRAVDSKNNTSTYYPNGTVSNALITAHNFTIPSIAVSASASPSPTPTPSPSPTPTPAPSPTPTPTPSPSPTPTPSPSPSPSPTPSPTPPPPPPATPSDTTVPTVSISSPTNGTTLAGDKTISASASDNIGVSGVSFYLDGILFGSEDTASPYSATLPTANYSSGAHALAAVARDAAGNAATSTATVYTYKSFPRLTSVALPTTILANGVQVISKITIANHESGNGSLAWRKLTLTYSKSANVTLSDFQIYNNGTQLADVSVSSSGSTITLVSATDQQVDGSKTYEIKATIGGSLQSGDYVTTTAQSSGLSYSAPTSADAVSASSALVWSDLSQSPHSGTSLDWNNDLSITTLPTYEEHGTMRY